MSENGELTLFERAVLDKLLAGDHLALKVLQAQAQALRVTQREWHGTAGFLTEVEVDPTAPWFGNYIDFQIHDVEATISGMRMPTIYMVFVRAGRLVQLKGTAFDDEPWPSPILDFELRYETEPRQLELPVAHFGDSDLPTAWQELHDATPADWYVQRPTQRRDGRWTMYVITPPDETRRGRLGREWTAIGNTEVECVREMARRLGEIAAEWTLR